LSSHVVVPTIALREIGGGRWDKFLFVSMSDMGVSNFILLKILSAIGVPGD